MRYEGFENLDWPLPGQNPASAAFVPCSVGEDLGGVLAKHLPRLYLTQQKHILVALVDSDCTKAHKKNVTGWRHINVDDIWSDWENENEAILKRLIALLRYILDGISYSTRNIGSIVFRDGELTILEPQGNNSGLRDGEFPEMPHPGRLPIIHLWGTMYEESLPANWELHEDGDATKKLFGNAMEQ
ncbi:hypothetical protein N431DRAFT_459899 [Stipitochalara longipes BDJ]|nr:hypothetical protein N431DRAFT_459899 [Stipitochalara longipes BDJ]